MSGLVTCLTQNVGAGVAVVAKDTTAAQAVEAVASTGAMTFWPKDTAALGTYGPKGTYATTDTDGTKLAKGSLWKSVPMSVVQDFEGGNGCLLTAQKAYGNTQQWITGRVWAVVDFVSPTYTLQGASPVQSAVMAFHTELLIASMYQSTGAKLDGTNWCSADSVTLKIGDKASSLIANAGWGAGAKCTFTIKGADGTAAPGFKLTTADTEKFLLYYVEWLKSDGFPSTAILSSTSGAAFHLGAYGTGADFRINPAKKVTDNTDVNWKGTADMKWAAYSTDPQDFASGSIGKITFFIPSPGFNGGQQSISTDSGFLMQAQEGVKNQYNDFNNQKSSYDGKRTSFNDAQKKEKERTADVFKATFEPKVEVPSRPCPPSQPAQWNGPRMMLSKGLEGSSPTTFASMKAKPQDYTN